MSGALLQSLIYVLSFVSGAAALIYEICWFRSLSLVFGGTQLAVTTTLSVFMLGLALGNWLSSRHIDRFKRLLFVYGFLEVGIALFAVVFLLLVKIYPRIYVPLAGIAPDSLLYLTFVRVIFSAIAMITSSTLMGATLPVLTSFLSKDLKSVSGNLSFLYGFNTLGAVAGAAAAGFLLLRVFPVSAVMLLTASANFLVGLVSFILQGESGALHAGTGPEHEKETPSSEPAYTASISKLVLWGIGISGFCALGYEVLWTRILVLFLGATVYSFTLILIAFLLGIGLGSAAYGTYQRIVGPGRWRFRGSILSAANGFGIAQVLIGLTTILMIRSLLNIPAYSVLLGHLFFGMTGGLFLSRQLGNFVIAFAFMVVPAFLMGLSMPLAGSVYAGWKRTTGRAVGELLAYNTVGAILGAAVSGYVFLYFVGIERSIQLLCLVNICVGLIVIAAGYNRRRVVFAAVFIFAAVGAFLFVDGSRFRFWDQKFLAVYTPDKAILYQDEEDVRRHLDRHEVLYYAEGFDAIVSSTLRRDTRTVQFSINGRPEASTNLEDVQNQYMLGHLPMLLHKNPKKALVIGAGSGMTLAAVFSHPGIEELHLVEIEPNVLGVARAFGEYNHHIVDHPDVEIIYNDARNYLLATREKFDVITADPIHPTWRGSGYLYTREYFKLASTRLSQGGIMCQWLPLYLLSKENVQSIVKTFGQHFRYVMVWLTMADVQLVGSNKPIVIDVFEMERRIREPSVYADLNAVFMGSAEEFMSYFLMGSYGAAAFSEGAPLNTDDNVYLEFSSPQTIGEKYAEARNLSAMMAYREEVAAYAAAPDGRTGRVPNGHMPAITMEMSHLADRAHVLYLSPYKSPELTQGLRKELDALPLHGRLKSISVGLFGYE